MEDALKKIDNLPSSPPTDKVTHVLRSNRDKKKNGFSTALKEKMKEKLSKEQQKKDELIHTDNNEEQKNMENENSQTSEQSENEINKDNIKKNNSDEDSDFSEHVDIKI